MALDFSGDMQATYTISTIFIILPFNMQRYSKVQISNAAKLPIGCWTKIKNDRFESLDQQSVFQSETISEDFVLGDMMMLYKMKK